MEEKETDVINEDVSNDVSSSTKDKRPKKKNWIKYIVLIIILMLLALMLHKCSGGNIFIKKGDINASGRNTLSSEDALEKNEFSVFLNKNVYIDDKNIANILVKNDKRNEYDAYVEYTIEDEYIFKTDIIKPGYKQEYADFGDSIEAGEYDAKAVFCIVDENGNKLNTVTTPVKITKQ